MSIQLRGITWNHSRGYTPMVATAQRFHETHPDIQIAWEKRSLQAFADHPLEKLVAMFDLLVIDHPHVGVAAAKGILLSLDEHLPKTFLNDQAINSVGRSHESYGWNNHHWALAIDAATPVASWRPDLLKTPPHTWKELLALAKRGKVALPGIPVDCLMHFYMLCIWQGEEPFHSKKRVVSEEVGAWVLENFRELHSLCSRECFSRNPIKIYEAMCDQNDIAYCPFAYGYSNYARDGYARKRLQFGDLVEKMSSTLGGTGLAISARCNHRKVAVEYAQFVAGDKCQCTLFVANGGQPGHRGAWLDREANHITHGYFRDTLPALDRAYLRPRYHGYMRLQDHGGDVVRDYLMKGGRATDALARLNKIYMDSQNQP